MKNGIEANIEQFIAWDHVMTLPRYAGGHDEIMKGIFGDEKTTVSFWNEGDYQGAVAVAHKLEDGRIVVMTDYYGSCSGCDAYEAAGDDEVKRLVTGMVQSSRVFNSIEDASEWCSSPSDEPQDYPFSYCANLKFEIVD